MPLYTYFVRQGNWLFKYRSFAPVVLLGICFLDLIQFKNLGIAWGLVSLAIGLTGQVIRATVVGFVPYGTSGRNRESQVADQLNTDGWYSVVRNPLYLGNFLMWLAPAMALGSAVVLVTFVFAFILHYERIIAAEEQFLSEKFGNVYNQWTTITPCFFPKLQLWKAPAGKFDLLKAMREEYRGLYALVSTVALVSALVAYIEVGATSEQFIFWRGVLVVSTIVFLIARVVHKIGKR